MALSFRLSPSQQRRKAQKRRAQVEAARAAVPESMRRSEAFEVFPRGGRGTATMRAVEVKRLQKAVKVARGLDEAYGYRRPGSALKALGKIKVR